MSNHVPGAGSPPGETPRLPASIRRQGRRQALYTIALASASVVLGSLGVFALLRPERDPLDGLICHEVRPLLPRFATGGLSERVRRQIIRHLDACPECRRLREQII